MDKLTSWYQDWLDKNKLPQQSADEVVYGLFNQLDNYQTHTLFAFIFVWGFNIKHENLEVTECYNLWLKERNLEHQDFENHSSKISEQDLKEHKYFKTIILELALYN